MRSGHVKVMRGHSIFGFGREEGRLSNWAEWQRTYPTRARAGDWETVLAQKPCVFWVITGFGVPSTGRGHAVGTNMLEPAWVPGPDTPPPSSSSSLSPPSVTTCPLRTAPSEEFSFVSSSFPFLSFSFSFPSPFPPSIFHSGH